MNWRQWFDGVKWPLALFWSLCLFVLLWGGQKIYYHNFVLRPAVAEIKTLEGIGEVRVGGNKVHLKLESQANLKATVESATSIAENLLGPDATLAIEDGRDGELVQLEEEISLSLAQAASRGEFETMRPYWTGAAQEAGAQIQVAVGPNAIYLTLRRGESYLYEIFPRQDNGSQVTAAQVEVGEGEL